LYFSMNSSSFSETVTEPSSAHLLRNSTCPE
jgi:hypothetical protein